MLRPYDTQDFTHSLHIRESSLKGAPRSAIQRLNSFFELWSLQLHNSKEHYEGMQSTSLCLDTPHEGPPLALDQRSMWHVGVRVARRGPGSLCGGSVGPYFS